MPKYSLPCDYTGLSVGFYIIYNAVNLLRLLTRMQITVLIQVPLNGKSEIYETLKHEVNDVGR